MRPTLYTHIVESWVSLEELPEDSYQITDARRGGYLVIGPSGVLGTFREWDDAIAEIVATMDKEQYWPDVFYINDHGNVDLMCITRELQTRPDLAAGIRTEVVSVDQYTLSSDVHMQAEDWAHGT